MRNVFIGSARRAGRAEFAMLSGQFRRQIRRGSGLRAWVRPASAAFANRVIGRGAGVQAFGRFFSRARFGSSAGQCTM